MVGNLKGLINKSFFDATAFGQMWLAKASLLDSGKFKIYLDDKISRIKQKGIYDKTEDTVKDLVGYLILLLIALKDKEEPLNQMKNRNKPPEDHEGWFGYTNNSWGI